MPIQESHSLRGEPCHPSVDETPRIRLISDSGKALVVPGAIIEAQFNDRGNTVLFTTENSPFEEALHIILIDENFEIADLVELSITYTPGMLRNIKVAQEDKIEFSFFRPDEIWSLQLLERPFIKLWANSHPVKRPSPFLHRTWMLLTRL